MPVRLIDILDENPLHLFRISDSDSEEDHFPLPKNTPITIRVGTPLVNEE